MKTLFSQTDISKAYPSLRIILCLLFLKLLVSGCQREENLLFDKTYNDMGLELVEQANQELLSAPNGWEMNYTTPNGEAFVLQFKFLPEYKVQIFTNYAGQPSVSSYRFNLSRGAVLSFDTYGLLHELANPIRFTDTLGDTDSQEGKGYQGDFEFEILDVSNKVIKLRGLKNNAQIVELLPLDHTPDAHIGVEEYIRSLNRFKEINSSDALFRNITDGGKVIGTFQVDYPSGTLITPQDVASIAVSLSDGTEYNSLILLNEEGFDLDTPLSIGGNTYQHFAYDEKGRSYYSKENSGVRFVPNGDMPGYEMNSGRFIPRMFYYGLINDGAFSTTFKRQIIQPYRQHIYAGASEYDFGWFDNTDEWRPFYFWNNDGWPQPEIRLIQLDDPMWRFEVLVPDDIRSLAETRGNGLADFLYYFTNFFVNSNVVYIEDVSNAGYGANAIRIISSLDSSMWFIVHTN